MEQGQINNIQDVRKFVLAGNATVTIKSRRTQTRFTFRIRTPKTQRQATAIWFVSLLSGPDNTFNYSYLGQIRGQGAYDHGRKSKVSTQAESVKAFMWFWQAIQTNRQDLFDLMEVWHEGRCGRCNKKLTVPESISSGYGPECIKMMG